MMFESLFLTIKTNFKAILAIIGVGLILAIGWFLYDAGKTEGQKDCADDRIAQLEAINKQYRDAQDEILRLQKERDDARLALANKEQDIVKEAEEQIDEVRNNQTTVVDNLRRTIDGMSVDLRDAKAEAATSRLAADTVASYARDQARLSESAVRFFVGEAGRADQTAIVLGSCQRVLEERQKAITEYNTKYKF